MERLRYDEDKAFFLADDASTIARIVRTVPADRLRATKFDEWTVLEIIGHVADAAEIFADRVQRCVDEDRPAVAAYDQDAVASTLRRAFTDRPAPPAARGGRAARDAQRLGRGRRRPIRGLSGRSFPRPYKRAGEGFSAYLLTDAQELNS